MFLAMSRTHPCSPPCTDVLSVSTIGHVWVEQTTTTGGGLSAVVHIMAPVTTAEESTLILQEKIFEFIGIHDDAQNGDDDTTELVANQSDVRPSGF